MKLRGEMALLVPLLVLVLAGGVWGAMEKAEMINGVQWAQWSNQDKLVYIRGISNWVDFESAAQTHGVVGGLAVLLFDRILFELGLSAAFGVKAPVSWKSPDIYRPLFWAGLWRIPFGSS